MLEHPEDGGVDGGAAREVSVPVRGVGNGELAALGAGEAVAALHRVTLKLYDRARV